MNKYVLKSLNEETNKKFKKIWLGLFFMKKHFKKQGVKMSLKKEEGFYTIVWESKNLNKGSLGMVENHLKNNKMIKNKDYKVIIE